MLSIISFICGWLSLIRDDKRGLLSSPNEYWKLVTNLHNVQSGDEFEEFAPQLTNLMRTTRRQTAAYNLERILLDKCTSNMILGVRLYSCAKTIDVCDESQHLRNKILHACTKDPSSEIRDLKIKYFDDSIFFTELVSQLSQDLQILREGSPRDSFFKHGLDQVNNYLTYRSLLSIPKGGHPISSSSATPSTRSEELSSPAPNSELSICRDIVGSGSLLHYPLLRSGDKMLRILRIATEECMVLPSKERCPYLLVVEVIHEDNSWGRDAGKFNEKSMLTFAMQQKQAAGLHPPRSTSSIGAPSEGNGVQTSEEESRDSNMDKTDVDNVAMMVRASESPASDDSDRDCVGNASPGQSLARTEENKIKASLLQPSPYFKRRMHRSTIYRAQQPATASLDGGVSASKNGRIVSSTATFKRLASWQERVESVRATSPYSHFPGWDVRAFIVKGGAPDIRREELAMQVIEYMRDIFRLEGIDINLRPYKILATGPSTGLVEYLSDTTSIDAIKKNRINAINGGKMQTVRNSACLREYFESTYGPIYSLPYAEALHNFVKSLAGYSLVTYILQVKDRHNGNILLDKAGNIVHIDFGFVLGESPAFNINFEAAPFKLTSEYIDLMGGIDSPSYKLFQELFVSGFLALQKHTLPLFAIVESFFGPDDVDEVVGSLKYRLDTSHSVYDLRNLIESSVDNWHTTKYDWIQQHTNNILM